MALDTEAILFNAIPYKLVSEETAKQLGRRRWQYESKPLVTQINPSRNLRQGENEGEWLLTIEEDDWRRGQSGARGEPGQCAFAFYASGIHGYIMQNQGPIAWASGADTQVADPCAAVLFNNQLFLIMGRYAYVGADSDSFTQDRDFGAGIYAIDALVHNSELIVVFGGATNKIQKRNTAGTWSTATDAVYSDHITHVQDRYWRATATNQVSNIGPTDNPFTLASYSAGITVGAADIGITDMNALVERVLVSKPEGLFPGDAAAQFDNVLPHLALAPDIDNGKSTVVVGGDVFYPYSGGLLRRYVNGRVEEVGLRVPFGDHSDLDSFFPATRIRSLTSQGKYLWAACEHSGAPWISPTVQKTVNNGVGYTNYSSYATDNDFVLEVDVASLDTVVNGDWLLIGVPSGSAAVYGFYFDGVIPNTATATMTVEYWDGAAWTAYTEIGALFRDGTASAGLSSPSAAPTITLSRSGLVMFPNGTQPTLSTISTLSRLWWRVSVSAALSSTCKIGEIRAITRPNANFNYPTGMLYRIRPAEAMDRTSQSLVWEPYSPLYRMTTPTAALFYGNRYPPYSTHGNLVVFGLQQVNLFPLPRDGAHSYLLSGSSAILGESAAWVTVLMDGGMPNVNKQWTRIRIRSAFSQNDTIQYAVRTDDTAAWPSSTTITSDDYAAALTSISGRRISIRFNLGASFSDNPPRILAVELVYRPLDTYVEKYTAMLELADNQTLIRGGSLVAAEAQLTALEALRGTSTTCLDPTMRSKTVTVRAVNVVEAAFNPMEHPALYAEVHYAEE